MRRRGGEGLRGARVTGGALRAPRPRADSIDVGGAARPALVAARACHLNTVGAPLSQLGISGWRCRSDAH